MFDESLQGLMAYPFGPEEPEGSFPLTPLKTTDSIMYSALTTLKLRLSDEI